MEINPDKLLDLRLKYLEMIQAVISRLAGYNAWLKNLCATVATAMCGLAINLHNAHIMLTAFLPIVVFAFQDTRYLSLERRFRLLYDKVRDEDWTTMPSFAISPSAVPGIGIWSLLASWSIWGFYLPFMVGVAILFVLTRHCFGTF